MYNKQGVTGLVVGLVRTLDTAALCIQAEQNIPVPTIPYSTVQLLTAVHLGHDEVRITEQAAPSIDYDETIEGIRELSFSVHFFKSLSLERASKFKTLLKSSVAREYMHTAGLSLGSSTGIRNLTHVIDLGFEPRHQLDIMFRVVDSEKLTVRSIQSIEVLGTYDSGQVTDITVTIP